MISTIRHIQYLILNYDCVVVPGFGAFVSRYVNAAISDDGTTLTPPSRELGFNALLTHDDGLLIGSITRREGVSYECARSVVEREVELIQRRLRHEGRLNMPRIGDFVMTSHGALEFTPDPQNGIVSLAYSGFCDIALPTAVSTTLVLPAEEPKAPVILEVDTTAAADGDVQSAPARRRLRPFIAVAKYAASAALLVGVCLTMLTPISPASVDFASLQPVVPQVTFADADRYAGREIHIFKPDSTEATAIVQPRRAIAETAGAKVVATDRYYVIVASTTSLREARRYVRMHSTPECQLSILPSDGRYRVYAASGNNFGEMSDYRTADKKFAAANPNAWVYTLK